MSTNALNQLLRSMPDLRGGNCEGQPLELFYPYGSRGGRRPSTVDFDKDARTVRERQVAETVCTGCPIKEPCKEWAITKQEEGVWGGLSEHDRRSIRRERVKGSRSPRKITAA